MKKAILAGLVVIMTGTAVSHSGGLPEAGSTPGSMMFALEEVQESVSLMFTPDEEKPQKKIDFAEERLSEALKLAEKNRSERASKAMDMYKEDMESLKRESPEIVNETSEHHMEILENLKRSLPESAHGGIQKAMDIPNQKESGTQKGSEEADVEGFVATGRVLSSN